MVTLRKPTIPRPGGHNLDYATPPELYAPMRKLYSLTVEDPLLLRPLTIEERAELLASPCSIWTGPTMGKAQTPWFYFRKRRWMARRLMFEANKGPLRKDQLVQSTCPRKNPLCVSVYHVDCSTWNDEHAPAKLLRMTPRLRRLALRDLRNNDPAFAVAARHNLNPVDVQKLVEDVLEEQRPRVLRGTKRYQVERMLRAGYYTHEIVSELYVNIETVLRVRDEMA